MNSQKVTSTAGSVGILMFLVGVFLMIVAAKVDIVFGVGLLFFLISITIGIIAATWSIAGTADRTLGRFLDGDSE